LGDEALGTLDVARAGFRIDRDQLGIDIGAELGRVGVHRLGHTHRATLQQRHTGGGGGELCDGQLERHERKSRLLRRPMRPVRLRHLSQRYLNRIEARGAISLTLAWHRKAREPSQNRLI
jgi:hypothetical protein